MIFALRCILGGGFAALLGAAWLVMGLSGADKEGIFAGGVWKGPLVMFAGVALVYYGVRIWRDPQQ